MVPVSAALCASTCLPWICWSHKYTTKILLFYQKDPNEEYHRISIPILYSFLEWALNLRRGKNGRRLPGIKCKSSLDTFWKVFRLVYERSTSNRIDNQMNRRMRRVCGPSRPLPQMSSPVIRDWFGCDSRWFDGWPKSTNCQFQGVINLQWTSRTWRKSWRPPLAQRRKSSDMAATVLSLDSSCNLRGSRQTGRKPSSICGIVISKWASSVTRKAVHIELLLSSPLNSPRSGRVLRTRKYIELIAVSSCW